MIALGSDHAGLGLKNQIAQMLKDLDMRYKDYGTYDETRCNYPEFGYKAAVAVANGECDRGIVFCGSGIGISLAANKVKGIRCAVCSEPYSALLSRQHNDTNMLALGSRVVGPELAKMIVRMWLDGKFEGGRHANRIAQIMEIEKGSLDLNNSKRKS
jgi:ribose 5-phosphate isomerase B